MGNNQCPAQDAAHLAAVARGICPFPSYNPSPHFGHMLSINSSHHLQEHYTAVQRSLTPKQLEDFTQSLRTTFGREGKVTLGGVGVVALSLAVLFDTVARQVRGEVVSDSGPIPGVFVKEPSGYYPPQVNTMSKYLRLVPHIANNPTRMREETERCLNQLIADEESLDQLGENHTLPIREDVTQINRLMGDFVAVSLMLHLFRLKNASVDEWDGLSSNQRPFHIVNFNCDTEAADKVFLAEVEYFDSYTKRAFEKCKPKSDPESWLRYIAELELADVMSIPFLAIGFSPTEQRLNQRENFDLKAHALGKWAQSTD
ncbi:uncharacterized protein LOC108238615 [Kryptolebias marmoratus]|uniref:uncharacterized protein LOC108238615 n=1 Tax=Kryptolebias marmoratus TaxID=37003 RepID=UPI0007F89F27|nr:uncharacterized protein LOC108238615 [Kryptolebias marmoratus]